MANNMVNSKSVLELEKPLNHDEVMKVINANVKKVEKKSWFEGLLISAKPASTTPSGSPVEDKVIAFNHLKGKQEFVFSIPGIDPVNVSISNSNRKISVLISNKLIGYITTYDQIDATEVVANYKFGRLIITITPNLDKFKEYEIKVNIQ